MTDEENKKARKKADKLVKASKKERVLHTRVPDVLEEQLKTMADHLKVPVSNVVRAILEDALDAADKATAATERGLRGWAERLHDERARLRDKLISGLVPTARHDATSDTTFAAVRGATVDESAEAAKHASAMGGTIRPRASRETSERVALRSRLLKGASGLQPLVLLRDESCAVCLRAMKQGEDGWVVIRSGRASKKPVLIGRECLPGARP